MLRYRAIMAYAARHWRMLTLVVVLIVAGGLGGPHLWAWYHYRAAETALAHFDGVRAQSHINACLAVWPWRARAHLLAARAARLNGSYEQAGAQLRECQRLQQPPSEESVLEWSLLRAAQGDLDKDVEPFLEAHAHKHPQDAPMVWEALAEGYLRTGRNLDALACLNLWLDKDPDNVQALTLRGNVGWQGRSPTHAVPDYRHVIELDPSRDEVRWKLALSLLDQGSYAEALVHLEHLRQRRPDDPDLLVRIARCKSVLGKGEEAQALLDAVLAGHPEHGPALRARGQLALAQDRPADAEKWLRPAVRLMPHDYYARYGLYQALNRQPGKEAEAQQENKRAEKLKARLTRLADITTRLLVEHPNDAALQSELGTLLLETGDPEAGLRWLASALRLDPSNRQALTTLADYYQEQGDSARAAAYRRQAQAASAAAPPSRTP